MNSNKSFNNFVSASGGQVIALMSQLIIIKVLTQNLSIQEFGFYSLVLIIPGLILPLIFSEVATSLNRFFFQDDKYKLYINCLSYIIFSFAIFFTLFSASIDITLPFITKFVQVDQSLIVLALMNHLFIYLGSINLSFYKLNYQPKMMILHHFLANIPKVILVITFKNDLTLTHLFTYFCLSHGLAFFITGIPLFFKAERKTPCFKTIKKIINYSVWLTPGSYFGVIINSCDRIFIKAFLGASQVGVYAIGYKVGDLIRQFFITSFNAVLSPVKFNINTEPNSYRKQMNLLFYSYVAIGLLLCLIINSLAKPLILIIANADYLESLIVIPLILSSHLIWGVNDFLNTGYLLKNKTKITSALLFVGAVINLLLNALLIPQLGLLGACLSTAISYMSTLPLSYLCSRKYHTLHFEFKKIVNYFFVYTFAASAQTYFNSSDFGLVAILIYNLSISIAFATLIYGTLDYQLKQILINRIKAVVKK